MKIKILLKFIAWAAFIGFNLPDAHAQCSANNSWGCGGWYGGDLQSIVVKDAAGGTLASYTGLGCASSNRTLNTGKPIDLVAGQQITIEVANSGGNWSTGVGIWLDQNFDGSFSTSECILSPYSTFYTTSSNPSAPSRVTITLPCWSGSGKSWLRLRSLSHYTYGLGTGSGCGTVTGYGSINDIEVNMKRLPNPTSDFNVPRGPNYERTTIKFPASSQDPAYTYSWTFAGPNVTVVNNASSIGQAKWSPVSPPSTHDVTLNVSYCGVSATKTKQITIEQPKAPPVADFIAKKNSVEIYNNAELVDLSTNGPYSWVWEAVSPGGNLYTSGQQNPLFFLDEVGKWNFCLTSQNGLGVSTKICKNQYVECTPPTEYYMGPQTVGESSIGMLYDHAGPSQNYTNNRRNSIDYFLIKPCDAKEIRLSFKSLRFCDNGDILRIYDSEFADPAKQLTPSTGINGSNWNFYRTQTFKATSGRMYLMFESNSSCTDSGFIAVWESDRAKPTPTLSSFTNKYDTIAEGVNLAFINKTSITGTPNWSWRVNNTEESTSKEFSRTFTSSGAQKVCLVAGNCSSTDTFCKTIRVVPPSSSMAKLDFVSDKVRVVPNETVTLTAETNFADNLEWVITPNSYTLVSGNLIGNSSQIQFKPTSGGCFTVQLKGYNSLLGFGTAKTVTKKEVVCAVDYCTPVVDLTNSDVGINLVELLEQDTHRINKTSGSGLSYSNFMSTDKASLNFGASYKVKVGRFTNINPINYKVWIDFNIDGDFEDAGETVLTSGKISGFIDSATFRVPPFARAFEGLTRMRVGASYGSLDNYPCGVNVVGEFEDYGITLLRDNSKPEITLLGGDTIYVEKIGTAGGCWAEAKKTTYMGEDGHEGDLTDSVKISGTFNCSVAGTYKLEFTLTDASGNQADKKTRLLIVENDRTRPSITLRGKALENIEQCGTFYDSLATAFDKTDGNLTDSIKVIGSVNTNVIGDYVLTYTVKDKAGLTASVKRTIKVRDTKGPGIFIGGSRILDSQVVQVQIGTIFTDYVYAEDDCNGYTEIRKMPGAKGTVNATAKGSYPTRYFATDINGNVSPENGYTLIYKVDDFVAPEIELNTQDTIYHDVKTDYVSRSVTIRENYSSPLLVKTTKSSNVNENVLGVYQEVFTAEDESGNKAIRTRVVKVVDRTAPDLLGGNITTCVGDPFWAMSGLHVIDNYYDSAALMPRVKVVSHNVNIWVKGIYFINYSLTDPSGNASKMISRDVHVLPQGECSSTYSGVSNLTADGIRVYPNPTAGSVQIDAGKLQSSITAVEVWDNSGRMLHSVKSTGNITTLQLNAYAAGVYTLKIKTADRTWVKPIILNK
jgi:PKD repeat protein